jgi:ribosomal protein S18 acetylase RimI-like enzyme
VNEVRLQRVGPDEWALWREVRLQALADAPHAFSSTLGEWTGTGDTETRWRSRLDAVALNLVAVTGARGVGQVSGTAIDEFHQVVLLSFWVAPEMRGQGVGDKLIDAVTRWAVEQGARGVVLSVKRGNRAAIAAYERSGFRRAGPAGEPDEWQMTLALP